MGGMFPPKSKKEQFDRKLFSVSVEFPLTTIVLNLTIYYRSTWARKSQTWLPTETLTQEGRKFYLIYSQKEGDHREMRYFIMFFYSWSFYLPAQVSFNRWIVQENMVDPYHEIVLSNKKERTIDTCNYFDESAGSHDEWKKQSTKVTHHVISIL